MITKEELLKVANLAKISLKEDEFEELLDTISKTLGFFEELKGLDVDGVSPTYNVNGLSQVVRDDVVEEITDEEREKLIASFPKKSGNLLKVKTVFENNEE